MTPHLTDAEIADICAPLKTGAAQCRFLQRLGFLVKVKPNGRPLVSRAHFDAVMGGLPVAAATATPQPRAGNVMALFRKSA